MQIRPIHELHVRSALEWLQSHSAACGVTLTDMSRAVGVSPCYLSRIIRSVTGLGFHAHLTKIRLAQADTLLKNARLSVKQVSYAVGYTQPSNFVRDFRAHFGSTPQSARAVCAASRSPHGETR
jgi:two-component system response regulator YesN